MRTYFKKIKQTKEHSIKYHVHTQGFPSKKLIALSVADSDYKVSPAIQKAIKKDIKHGFLGYFGNPDDYCQTIQTWFLKRYQVNIDTSWVVAAPKVLNAIAVTIQTLLKKGSRILIQTPVYHVFKPVILKNECDVVENKLIIKDQRFDIDFEQLDKDLSEQIDMFIFCSPHNPVGRVYSKVEIEKVVNLCKKHDVFLISDEIHADLIMPGYTFFSTGHLLNGFDKLIIISAPSKTFNVAGLQIAHLIIANPHIREKIINAYQKLILSSPNRLAHRALKAAYLHSDHWVEAQNSHIYTNYHRLEEMITLNHKDLWLTPLEGTYLAWLNIKCLNIDSQTFVNNLVKEEGLVLSPGQAFSEDADDFVRINLATSKKAFKEAIKRLNKYLISIKGEDK